MRANVMRYWYQETLHPILFLLIPFTALFSILALMRRWLYRVGLFEVPAISVPVIIVGNITVGGTGKTPFVMWLAHFLQEQGYRPGIVSRGVGGVKQRQPRQVNVHDQPEQVGDEALLLAQHAKCPVVIGIDRVAAANFLLQHSNCNIIISDDGLQHYRLKRDIEIVMVDGERRMGNQWLLPAGPLREPTTRLNAADFVVVNAGGEQDQFSMVLRPVELVSVANANQTMELQPGQTVHAVAGIGNPQRFFSSLEKLNFTVIPHVFPDHYLFTSQDIQFADDLPIIMTEKDAVKCKTFANQNTWFLRVSADVSPALTTALTRCLSSIR